MSSSSASWQSANNNNNSNDKIIITNQIKSIKPKRPKHGIRDISKYEFLDYFTVYGKYRKKIEHYVLISNNIPRKRKYCFN